MESVWLSLLPLVIVILLIWLGAKRFQRGLGAEGASPAGLKPYGVHGWLAFYVFTSKFIAPLFILGTTVSSIADAERKYPALLSLDGWGSYKALTWAIVIAAIAWQVWVATLLRHKFEVRSLQQAKLLCFAAPWAIAAADIAGGKLLLGVDPVGEAVAGYIKGLISGLIWGLYFVKSKRCRNTYAPVPLPSHRAEAPSSPASVAPSPHDLHPTASPPQSPMKTTDHPLSRQSKHSDGPDQRLIQLQKLLEQGLISNAEYIERRRSILESL